MKVAQNARVSARLDGHPGRFGLEVLQHLPQVRGKQIVFLHPTDFAIGLTNFYLILKSLQNIQALTEGNRSDGFADLRGSAPHRGLFASSVRNFDRRGGMMKTNIEPNRENQYHRRSEKDFSDQAGIRD